jgi:hypothetical protein
MGHQPPHKFVCILQSLFSFWTFPSFFVFFGNKPKLVFFYSSYVVLKFLKIVRYIYIYIESLVVSHLILAYVVEYT